MSLKDVDFDPYLLASIFPGPLVQKQPDLPKSHLVGDQPLPFLGNNRQQILLVIQNKETAYLSEPIFDMMTNLLSACKLGLDDVALVNLAQFPGIGYRALKQSFHPHKVILFDTVLPEISGGKAINRPWEEEGAHFLLAESLEAMYEDKQLKVPFWNALRQFFNLDV